MTEHLRCPLCHGDSAIPHYGEATRHYFKCPQCLLIYLDPDQRLRPLEEVMRYCEHQNHEGDPDYEAFLCRLADPLVERLGPRARGLDYGCGPTPVLASIMTRRGYPTDSYDPFFNADEGVHDRQFDFITCSEVIEHVYDPCALLDRLAPVLRGGGLLGVMTRFYGVEAPFADWWYRRDPTHVCFYSPATMEWIAAWKGWVVDFPRQHVAIFTVA